MINKTKILERLWKDKMDIVRSVETTNQYGGTAQEEKVVYSDIKCKLSSKILRAPEESNNPSTINQYKIFTYPDVDIKQNDIIVLTRAGVPHKFNVTKPFIYPLSHLEIVVDEVIDGGA